MNFNEWWNSEGSGITPQKGHDMEAHAKRIAELGWNRGRKQERERCINAIESVKDTGDTNGLAQIRGMMMQDDKSFAGGVSAIIQLTKSSAIEAINSVFGGRKH